MDYSEPLTRLEKLPSLISDCFRKGDKESAYLYLEEVKERVSELQAWVRMDEAAYRSLLNDIGGSRGEENRIVGWIMEIEREEGLAVAIATLDDYIEHGCGISG